MLVGIYKSQRHLKVTPHCVSQHTCRNKKISSDRHRIARSDIDFNNAMFVRVIVNEGNKLLYIHFGIVS